jgi:hypothetical protein
MAVKVCSKCKEGKLLTEFSSNKSRKDGKHHRCNICNRIETKKWQQANVDKVKNNGLKYQYGITLAKYLEILEAQNGRCILCDTDTPGGRGSFHVDHCHNSGKIRGLLCHHCNVGLGHFKDQESLLLKAALYLHNHRVNTTPSH